MNGSFRYGLPTLIVALCFTVALTVSPESTELGRGFFVLLLLGGSYVLPLPQALAAGVLTIPADLTLVTRGPVAGSPNSVDLLVWAAYVGIPLLVTRYLEGGDLNVEVGDDAAEDPGSDRSQSPPEEAPGNVTLHPEVQGETDPDPSEQLQELLVNRFREAHRSFGSDNLIYFHVRDDEARPGYVINDYGTVDSETTVGTDQARGVGWVLRHGEELSQDESQLDWRNLHYHTQPLDLERVLMKPVETNNRIIGVLVLEWKEDPDLDAGAIDDFVDEVQALMSVDRAVRGMERKEREVDLLKRFAELEPLATERLETLRQRIKDLVRDLIPADHVEFVTEDDEQDDTVLKQRRLFYEKCCDWIRKQNDPLRINDVANFSLQGRRVGNIAPPDVSSFLGGAVADDDRLYGFLCLDDADAEYFTSEDEKLLRLLLDQSAGLMKAAVELSDLKTERRRLLVWLENVTELDFTDDFESLADRLTRTLSEGLPVGGVGFYARDTDEYRLTASEGLTLPDRIRRDSALVTRLRDTEGKVLVNFPNPGRMEAFRGSVNSYRMAVCPVQSDDGDLGQFVVFFYEEEAVLGTLESLNPVWKLLVRELGMVDRKSELERDLRVDDWSDFPEYGAWKRSFGAVLNGEDLRELTVWGLRVPGFESIAETRGRQRVKKWIRSLANRINEDFSVETVTRAYSSRFYGFSTADEESVRRTLESVRDDVSDWSFPSGEWPDPPGFAVLSFREPFPEVGAIVDATRKELLTTRESDEERKGMSSDVT